MPKSLKAILSTGQASPRLSNNTRRPAYTALAQALTLILAGAPAAHAAVFTWAGGDDLLDPNSWDQGSLPGAADDADVVGNLASDHFLTLNGNASINKALINNTGGGLITVTSSAPDTLFSIATNFTVGSDGRGAYHQADGNVQVGGSLGLGTLAGGEGSYQISSGSLTVAGNLEIGNNNGGTGHFVQYGNVSTSSLLLDSVSAQRPAGYELLQQGTLNSGNWGSLSNASLFIQSGASQHINSGYFYIGNAGPSDSLSLYTLSGEASSAIFNNLFVGGFGQGVFQQNDGIVEINGELKVGDGPNLDPERRYGRYEIYGGQVLAHNNFVVGGGNESFPDEPGGLGSVVQDGTTSIINIDNDLIVGQAGSIGGGTGSYTLFSGSLNVNRDTRIGDGSTIVGGTGSFSLDSGTHNTNGLFIGSGSGNGTYNLFNGVLNAGITYIGEGGEARFGQQGGTFNTTFLNVGIIAGSQGTLNLAGGAINVAANLGVGGPDSTGTVNQSGGLVQTHDLFINNNGRYNLNVGSLLTNTTTISTGGSLKVDNQASYYAQNQLLVNTGGEVALNNASLTTENGIDLIGNLTYTGLANIFGTLVNNGSVAFSPDINNPDAGGQINFFGNVSGAGSYNGAVNFQAGFNPGNSPAAIDFGGGLVNFGNGSILTLEINGYTAGSEYDQLLNIDTLTFNGNLVLAFGNGFDPLAGGSLDLFDFNVFNGVFDPNRISVTGLALNRLDFSHLALDGSLHIAAVPVPSAFYLFGSALLGLVSFNRRRTIAAA